MSRHTFVNLLNFSGFDGPEAFAEYSNRPTSSSDQFRLSTGYGMIGKADDNHISTTVPKLLGFDYISFIQATMFWKNLQPTPTTWDFSSVDTLLNYVRGTGKKLLLTLATTGDPGLPSWYFTDGTANRLTITSGARQHPVFWDQVYMTRILALFQALAHRYMDEPLIEAWRGFGYSTTSFEPNFWDNDTQDATLKAQVQAGVDADGRLFTPHPYRSPAFNKPDQTATTPYTLAVTKLIRMWHNVMPRHNQIVTIHFPASAGSTDYALDIAMRDVVAELGLHAVNTGLNDQDNKTTARTYFADIISRGARGTGWGGQTGMSADWYEMYRQGIGGVFAQGSYLPRSFVSYIVVNEDDLPDKADQVRFADGLLYRTAA